VASQEVPELSQKFILPHRQQSYHAFRTAARGMEAEAGSRKELLVKHGLSETVLQALTQALNEFDAMVEQGSEGRRSHVGASAELENVADEVLEVVKVMDGLNRFRFGTDSELLASWESASNIFAAPHPAEEKPAPVATLPAAGDVRPAA